MIEYVGPRMIARSVGVAHNLLGFSDEKRLSIAALFQMLLVRLIEQDTLFQHYSLELSTCVLAALVRLIQQGVGFPATPPKYCQIPVGGALAPNDRVVDWTPVFVASSARRCDPGFVWQLRFILSLPAETGSSEKIVALATAYRARGASVT